MVGNKAPVLTVEGPKNRTAKVGEPVALAAVATDDGKPNKRNMPAMLGGNYILPQSANGLRLSFFVYRGTGKAVTFDPPQTEGLGRHARRRRIAVVRRLRIVRRFRKATGGRRRATFAEPGTYVIRALAHDGGLFSSQDVTVVVSK